MNTDEIDCPISFTIKNNGCKQVYSGDVLSLNENNELMAKMNHDGEVNQIFCIEASNKNQVISIDQIQYFQFSSCRDYMVINKEASKPYISTNPDQDYFFKVLWASYSGYRIDIKKLVKWPKNKGCSRS